MQSIEVSHEKVVNFVILIYHCEAFYNRRRTVTLRLTYEAR